MQTARYLPVLDGVTKDRVGVDAASLYERKIPGLEMGWLGKVTPRVGIVPESTALMVWRTTSVIVI